MTQAMTSLTGSAGEDFASILRALGYRMDRRAPLPPKPVAPVEAAPAETGVDDLAEGAAEITIARDIIRCRKCRRTIPQNTSAAEIEPASTGVRAKRRAVGRVDCLALSLMTAASLKNLVRTKSRQLPLKPRRSRLR